jgi:hypothetical protein
MSKSEMDIDTHALNTYEHIQYVRLEHARRQKGGQQVLAPFYANKHEQRIHGGWRNDYQLLPKGLRCAESFQNLGCGTKPIPSFYSVAVRSLTLISNALTSKGWLLPHSDSTSR